MGLHLPGSAFVNPGTPLREALTAAATRRVAGLTALGTEYTPIGEIVDERGIVNAIVGLLATGGSTNHTLHLVAIARAAGIAIDWTDFDELSGATPLLARMYPNGQADVNHFHAAGGMGLLIRELLDAGLLHEDVRTVMGEGLRAYAHEPWLDGGRLDWRAPPAEPADLTVLRTAADPFQRDGGVRLLCGNLGRAIFKASAVKPEHRSVTALARVFDGQDEVLAAFKAGELDRDVVVVVRFQGPRANGMPELHQAHAEPVGAAGPGPQRRAGHRWPHERRFGQGAGRHPPLARGCGRRSAGPAARRRPRSPRRRRGRARGDGRRRRLGRARTPCPSRAWPSTAMAASCSQPIAMPARAPNRGRQLGHVMALRGRAEPQAACAMSTRPPGPEAMLRVPAPCAR